MGRGRYWGFEFLRACRWIEWPVNKTSRTAKEDFLVAKPRSFGRDLVNVLF
jgi:hypothetical protein